MSGPLSTKSGTEFEREMEQRLRADYVAGRIDVEDFERRIGRIVSGDPSPVDKLRLAHDHRWMFREFRGTRFE